MNDSYILKSVSIYCAFNVFLPAMLPFVMHMNIFPQYIQYLLHVGVISIQIMISFMHRKTNMTCTAEMSDWLLSLCVRRGLPWPFCGWEDGLVVHWSISCCNKGLIFLLVSTWVCVTWEDVAAVSWRRGTVTRHRYCAAAPQECGRNVNVTSTGDSYFFL